MLFPWMEDLFIGNFRRQILNALSSAELKYVGMSSCAKQVIWPRRLLWKIRTKSPYPVDALMALTVLFSYITASIALSLITSNSQLVISISISRRIKLWNWYKTKQKIFCIRSRQNVAEIVTKLVRYDLMRDLRQKLQVEALPWKMRWNHYWK